MSPLPSQSNFRSAWIIHYKVCELEILVCLLFKILLQNLISSTPSDHTFVDTE